MTSPDIELIATNPSPPAIDGWMDGWMDRWMDGWMDRWMDG